MGLLVYQDGLQTGNRICIDPLHECITPRTPSNPCLRIVWKVSESSSVAPGTLYIFLSEGTLLVASPHGKPALGTWKDLGGVLTMVEEGIPYQVDVLGLTQDQFKIRSHNPAKPAEITLIAAERPSR